MGSDTERTGGASGPVRIGAHLGALLFISAVSACGGPTSAEVQKIEEVKLAVQQLLKDPQSAQFSNVRIVEGLVCGEVNAKNAFGGYVGRRTFWGGRPEVTAGEEAVISDKKDSPCDLLGKAGA